MNHFAKNLLFLRKRKKLSQSEMPELTGIGRATWSNYENSDTEPNIDGLIRIAKFFEIDLHTLITVDLAKNAHLLYNNETKGNKDKSTHNIENWVGEASVPLIKKEVNLLILQQLNLLTREVKDLRTKLDK